MTKAERDLLMAVAAMVACWGNAITEEERIEACRMAGIWRGQDCGPDILAKMRAVAAEP